MVGCWMLMKKKILILVCLLAVLLAGADVGTVQVNAAVRNRITGTKRKGYVYVDRTGTVVKAGEIRQAVDFVLKNSSSLQIKSQG